MSLLCVRKKFEPICKISLCSKIRCRTLLTNYANIRNVLSQLETSKFKWFGIFNSTLWIDIGAGLKKIYDRCHPMSKQSPRFFPYLESLSLFTDKLVASPWFIWTLRALYRLFLLTPSSAVLRTPRETGLNGHTPYTRHKTLEPPVTPESLVIGQWW